jgi:hypothetical protein
LVDLRAVPRSLDSRLEAVMLRMEWNALRVGDHVAVHDDDDLVAPLAEGTIRVLQSRPAGWNDLAIHLAGSTGPVIRPRGGACHLLPFRSQGCWRCDVLANAELADTKLADTKLADTKHADTKLVGAV